MPSDVTVMDAKVGASLDAEKWWNGLTQQERDIRTRAGLLHSAPEASKQAALDRLEELDSEADAAPEVQAAREAVSRLQLQLDESRGKLGESQAAVTQATADVRSALASCEGIDAAEQLIETAEANVRKHTRRVADLTAILAEAEGELTRLRSREVARLRRDALCEARATVEEIAQAKSDLEARHARERAAIDTVKSYRAQVLWALIESQTES
jgi:hypothetical protein